MRAVNGGFDKLFKRIVKGEISLSLFLGVAPRVSKWRGEIATSLDSVNRSVRPVSYGLKLKGEKEEGKKEWKRAMEMEIERMKSFRAKRNVFKAHASLERVFLRMWEVSDDAIVDII